MNGKVASGLSPYTVRNHHNVLRSALGQAERWGLVHRNVASLVTPPRIPHEEVHPLTVDQARAFLDGVKGHRLEPLFSVALVAGLRQSEVLGLSWPDINLDTGTLTIQASLQRYGGAYHRDEVKTPRSRRVIGLPSPVTDQLRVHRKRQLEERLRLGTAWRGNAWDLVFTSELGEPLYGTEITWTFQLVLSDLGLPRQRFHDLRHAAASFMLAQGVPLKIAQEVLGHATIAVTGDTYTHVSSGESRRAVERVGELFWGTN